MSSPYSLLVHALSTARSHEEHPECPETVQAMQMVLHLPKNDPPARSSVLQAAARAAIAVCLDKRAGEQDSAWRTGLQGWYDHRIRKVARRARNKAWEDVHRLPGVTITDGRAEVRALVPSSVKDIDPLVRKLQIQGTDLDADAPGDPDPKIPLILVDRGLGMTVGKAAAQVGHASMFYAASLTQEQAAEWAEAGFPLAVREVTSEEFSQARTCEGAVEVADAGFTEVAPGSVTVVALGPRKR